MTTLQLGASSLDLMCTNFSSPNINLQSNWGKEGCNSLILRTSKKKPVKTFLKKKQAWWGQGLKWLIFYRKVLLKSYCTPETNRTLYVIILQPFNE